MQKPCNIFAGYVFIERAKLTCNHGPEPVPLIPLKHTMKNHGSIDLCNSSQFILLAQLKMAGNFELQISSKPTKNCWIHYNSSKIQLSLNRMLFPLNLIF